MRSVPAAVDPAFVGLQPGILPWRVRNALWSIITPRERLHQKPAQQVADPKFVSYISAGSSSNNYHLQASSPAITAGTYLTTVAAGDSGSGTSLVVNDASYFQDSYGLSNDNSTVYPDCISVTTVGNHVCITAVNYSTNTLTMASGFSRSDGDHVQLYSKSDGVQVLTGTAPDFGEYPYQSALPNRFWLSAKQCQPEQSGEDSMRRLLWILLAGVACGQITYNARTDVTPQAYPGTIPCPRIILRWRWSFQWSRHGSQPV